MEYSRKKSCTQCRTAKTRCSLDLPACARCTKRGIPCSYEVKPRIPTVSLPAPIPALVPETPFHSWLLGTKTDPASDGCPVYGAVQHVGNLFASSMGLGPGVGRSLEETSKAVEELNSMDWSRDETNQPAMQPSRSVSQNSVPAVENPDSNKASSWAGSSTHGSIDTPTNHVPAANHTAPAVAKDHVNSMTPPLPELQGSKFILARWDSLKYIPNDTDHILKRRPVTKMAELLKGNLLQSTFESYVFNLDKNELPPFIHRNCIVNDAANQTVSFMHLPKALANSKAVLPMYLHNTACRPLVIKTLLLEVQRIHDEFGTYDEDGLLHSLQALAIYLILLARDTQRYYLISIVTRITISEISSLCNKKGYQSLKPNFVFSKWEDWVREESKIRTILLIYLMIRLVDMDIMDPTRPPCHGFENIPLPASRSLWEAETASVWEDRYKAYLASRKGATSLKIGDLRQSLDADVDDVDLDVVNDLSNWSKEIDGFGGVVLNCGLLAK